MKAILKFDLEDVDDSLNHKSAIYAPQMSSALFEITHNLKKQMLWTVEANIEKYKEDPSEVIYEMMDKIFELTEDIPTELIS